MPELSTAIRASEGKFRGTYYKSISGHVWGDPHQYEMSVDSSIGPEKTAELICGYINHM